MCRYVADVELRRLDDIDAELHRDAHRPLRIPA
jgi:hypothetical protein